jgi:hypothetical protein
MRGPLFIALAVKWHNSSECAGSAVLLQPPLVLEADVDVLIKAKRIT